MATWGGKRQFVIIGVISSTLIISLSIFVYLKFFNNAPTCFDNVLNQNEHAIDCGGVCSRVCAFESIDPINVYSRIFETKPGVYSLLANIENNNQSAYAKEVEYAFRVYDADSVLIGERAGKTFIPPNAVFPILEYNIFTDQRIPTKATFSFKYPINWQKGPWNEPRIKILNVSPSNLDSTPVIEADIQNGEVFDVKNIQVIAVIYDDERNAMGTTQTLIDVLPAKGKKKLVFTWNKPFPKSIGKIDIIPRVIPRDIK